MKGFHAARTRLRLLFARRAAETRMQREFQFHIDMEAERLVRERGLAPGEARRRALAAFGGVEKHKEALRDGRGFSWLRGWSLNVKLGARIFAKYPGVSIVGILAMTIGIGLAAAYLEAVNDFLRPTLPLPEGQRIVGLQNWDLARNAPDPRSTRDFLAWREELQSVERLSAYREVERNIGPLGGAIEAARGVEMTASGFDVARVPAAIGRTLLDADEQPGGPAVIVLAHQLWRSRFGSDAGIVGRAIQVGAASHTVVGVMPEGFGFPVSEQFWLPLRLSAPLADWRQGPALRIFGRLAEGASLAGAQAELDALGARASSDRPHTHEHLRPQVMRFPDLFVGDDDNWQAYVAQLVFVGLLLVLGANVATMVFARTATREHEIAMRFALGASRGQILAQFFAEALVLAAAATLIALTIIAWGAQWFARFFWDVTQGRVPFWLNDALNTTTVLYAVLLALLVSAVAGVLPALKATGRRARARLRHAPGTGESALRFGGLWSVLVVVQVVFAVVVLPPAIVSIAALGRGDHTDPGFAADEYLSARLDMDVPFAEFRATADELRRRLLANPNISRVTFATRLPGMSHPDPDVEVDSERGALEMAVNLVTATAVDVAYFDAFGAPILAGRAFDSADVESGRRVVIVNEYFVDELLHGRNAVGRRIRYSTRYGERAVTGEPDQLTRAEMLQPGPWYEIVGVVRNLGMDTTRDVFASGRGPGVYHPLRAPAMGTDGHYSVRIAFHVRGDVVGFASEFRRLAQNVHPALRLQDVLTLDGPVDRVSRTQRQVGRVMTWMTALVAFIALLISTAGTYSVLAFTVSRQTREIGIRLALGADARRIVTGVFSRAMIQIVIGIVLGAVIWFYLIVVHLGGSNRLWLLLTSAAVLMVLALFACGVPVRRALRVEPTEALRHAG